MNDRIDRIIALLERHRVVRVSVLACCAFVAATALWLLAAGTFERFAVNDGRELSLALVAQEHAQQAGAVSTNAPPPGEVGQEAATPAVVPQNADSFAPRIDLIGEPVVEIAVGESYTDDGARAFNREGDELQLRTYVDGGLVEMVVIDTSAPQVHEIEYRTADGDGVTASMTRTVVVR